MVIVVKNYTVSRVQILDKASYISHGTNTFGKGNLPPLMGK